MAPELEYGPDDQVRRVQLGGVIHFQGEVFKVSKAFAHQKVAFRPTDIDGAWGMGHGASLSLPNASPKLT